MKKIVHEVLEFRLSKGVPHGSAFVLALGGAFLLFVVIWPDAGAPPIFALVGLSLLFLSAICASFGIVVRMDSRTGKIEKTISTLLWKRHRNCAVSEFTEVGVGMAGGSSSGGYFSTTASFFVQLIGDTNVNIPSMSTDKEYIVALAKRVASYLDLPIDEEPKLVFFQQRWNLGRN